MLVHHIFERYAAAKYVIRHTWLLSGPYKRATMMCGKWLSGEEKTLRIQNNFPIFVVQSDFRIRDYKSIDISTSMPILRKGGSWRCRQKIKEQRHEPPLRKICHMHILWYLLWPLAFSPNKTSRVLSFIFPVSRPVLTLLSPPRVSPRSPKSAASLSHASNTSIAAKYYVVSETPAPTARRLVAVVFRRKC